MAGQWHEHLGAIFTVVLSLFIIVGTTWILITTSLSLKRLVRAQKAAALARRDSAETRGTEVEEEELSKGEARRLRKVLVICLMGSDGLVALSSLGPAVLGIVGAPLVDEECGPPGFILATALWWQYGFSLVIAITTYIALRHPLSCLKRTAEQRTGWIVALILLLGCGQAITWRYVHGFEAWKDYCFYGLPTHRADELIQFIPRLVSSLLIALIYLPLIHFLRRPDLTALYLSPRPASFTFCPDTTPQPDIPPWERLSFPNFNGLGLSSLDEKDDPSPHISGGIIAPVSLTTPLFPALPKAVYLGESLSETGSTSSGQTYSAKFDGTIPRGSLASEMTLVPSLKVSILNHKSLSIDTTDLYPPPASRRNSTRSSKSPISPRFLRLSPNPGSRCSCKDAEKEDASAGGNDFASFRGMLESTPCPKHPTLEGMLARSGSKMSSGENARPGTPTRESMASFMNRRTSSFLIWFPLTHLVICAVTLTRFVYFCVEKIDGKAIEALTLTSLLCQGVADVVVFGLIERRTQQRYRQEVAACTPRRGRVNSVTQRTEGAT